MLVEFGALIDEHIHGQVIRLDAVLRNAPFGGFIEAVPAYASLLVRFDPLVTDHGQVKTAVSNLIAHPGIFDQPETLREVHVCYDPELAPDLLYVARACGLSPDEVVNAHLAGEYKVFMYGFAPGYAYLAGVPRQVQLPRKQAAVRGVSAGSVLIAGPQCLVTTLEMPTGWWIIGRSPTKILDRASEKHPFLFEVGDRVRFRRISRADFDMGSGT
ncbi:kinase [Ensifer sp. Root127]|nr:kinase [Ensifer sp. Root127]